MTRFFGTAGFLLAQSNKIHFVWCGAILPMFFAEADSGYKAASAVTGVLAAAMMIFSYNEDYELLWAVEYLENGGI